jgi:hypothetical protein
MNRSMRSGRPARERPLASWWPAACVAGILAIAAPIGAAPTRIPANVNYDSLCVALGRRPDAALVKATLTGGARDLDSIGRAFAWAIHHAKPDSLYRLCVTEKEFEVILWPEFEQSRPLTGLKADDAWMFLEPRNTSGIRSVIGDHEGRYLEFLRFERRAPAKAFNNFRLHQGLVMVVRNERGEEERLDHLKAVVERKGRFKIYSMRD